MGRASWSAFGCSALADDPKEQERLFTFGYEQGLKFIAALQAKAIKEEDLQRAVPIGVSLVLQGPTPDFMLGRVFESAVADALKEVFPTDGRINSKEEQKALKASKFQDANCSLLGRQK
jgi:hypothetical protein